MPSPAQSSPANTLLARMFAHHKWSNLILVDFLADLPANQLDLVVPGTYGTVLETIRHIISSDADYVRIIPDTPEVPQISETGPFEGWAALREVAEIADETLVAYVSNLADDLFFVDVDEGVSYELTRSFLLTQIIHHATEHRSQIRSTLSTHGVTPPEISVWAWRSSDEGKAYLRTFPALS